jgi:mono/diheme cytochrome c family protein
MRSLSVRGAGRWALALGATVVASAAAFGLPWDVDMADSVAVKAYEAPMAPLPEGVVSQANISSPNEFVPNYDRASAEGQALRLPYPADAQLLATGERMYDVYCTPCHGVDENLGTVAQPGRFPGIVAVLGKGGVAPNRTDGHIYLTIRNGGALMPAYGYAMTDYEMWSIVHWLRQQPTGRYIPPAPPKDENAP